MTYNDVQNTMQKTKDLALWNLQQNLMTGNTMSK